VATVPYRILCFMVQIPTKGFKIINSEVLSWAYCDSSKPGRSGTRYMLVCCLHTFIERNDQVLRYVSIIDYF
jgi:predicted NAD/FAD-dependent oxidoreductase